MVFEPVTDVCDRDQRRRLADRPESATPSVDRVEPPLVSTDRALGGRRVVFGLVAALVAVTAAFGAVLGYALPAWSGIEELAVLAWTIPITPTTLALYGGVTIGVFLVTFLLVVQAVSRFDENAVDLE